MRSANKPSVTQLEVAGVPYAGWKKIQITRSLEHISGSFDLAITDRWTKSVVGQFDVHEELVVRPIKPGATCRVLVDRQPVITGYVDRVTPRMNAQERALSITGRDRTADLVDCSALPHAQYANATLASLIESLAAPFKIRVVDTVRDSRVVPLFGVEPGETAFEAMKRAALMRGVLLMSDGHGRLVIGRASAARLKTALVQGENILEAECEFNVEQRFSMYIVKGQTHGNEFANAANAAALKGEVKDASIGRYRPLLTFYEGSDGTIEKYRARAIWERNTRAGQGSRATVLVQGWHHAEGLWAPNRLVRLKCPSLGVDEDLLICQVTYLLDEQGTRAELSLAARQAFDVLETVKHKGKENPLLKPQS